VVISKAQEHTKATLIEWSFFVKQIISFLTYNRVTDIPM